MFWFPNLKWLPKSEFPELQSLCEQVDFQSSSVLYSYQYTGVPPHYKPNFVCFEMYGGFVYVSSDQH